MNRDFLPQMGLSLHRSADGAGLDGTCVLVEDLCAPGTDRLRASVLVLWVDVISGLLTTSVVAPRVPVTLELSLDMFEPARLSSTVDLAARVVKAGSAVTHVEVELRVDGAPAGLASASFMLLRDTSITLSDSLDDLLANFRGELRVGKPYAERVDCRRLGRGRASMPRTEDTVNASDTVHGGLIAVPIEEAVLSAAPAGAVVSAMALRYVRPARVGPAVAVAERFGDLWRVDVQDAGAGDRSCVHATVRTTRRE